MHFQHRLVLKIASFIGILILLVGCSGKESNHMIAGITSDTSNTIINKEIAKDSFINRINSPSLELPYISSFISSRSVDTLTYDFELKNDKLSFRIYLKNNPSNKILIDNANGFEVYAEGDIDGDDTEEIGIIEAYQSSACRQYKIYSYKRGHWKLLYSIPTHLPDRAQGVDYIKREGNKIRIIKAQIDQCCQCEGLDTVITPLN